MLYPLLFHPIFKERVWGGRNLERLYGKALPPQRVIGESWELSDRPGDASVVANGPLAGKNLRWLMEHHQTDLLGKVPAQAGRFPLLIKLLDAQDKLSLQVHPPAREASALDGEPKTEMWYIADAAPGAQLYVGLRKGVTRQEFERKLATGEVAQCFHQVSVRAGDTMFLPSGRVHAIGAGLVIFEIQQNSDTTYRVFDWNRLGLDGKPRQVHLQESLASIDFADFEPPVVSATPRTTFGAQVSTLVNDPLFSVEIWSCPSQNRLPLVSNLMQIIGTTRGSLIVQHQEETPVPAGSFCLVPASLSGIGLLAERGTEFLRVFIDTGPARY